MEIMGALGGPGALYYLCVTTCEYHNKTFALALPLIHLGGLPEASDKLYINWEYYFRNRDPQVLQVAVHHMSMWAPPRFFFEISCPDGSYEHGQQPNLASLGRI